MNLCEETDPELSTRNNKSGVELSVEARLIVHKGSSYQKRAGAIEMKNNKIRGEDDEWKDHMETKSIYACKPTITG